MRAKDVMTKGVVKIDLQATAAEASTLMKHHGIHHLLVYDGRKMAGILSARDLEQAPSGMKKRALAIGDVMSRRVVTAEADAPVPRLANLVRGHAIGCVVVTDRGRAVGMITTADLLELLGRGAVYPVKPGERPDLSYRTPHRRKTLPSGVW
jgi:acetoin utilization protein AcuB